MKKRNKIKIVIVSCMLLLLTIISVQAQSNEVKVTLPTFDVKLNGIKVDTAYSEYPLLVYKDITYFPFTYNDCRFLGLETDWNPDEGLSIKNTGIYSPYKPYERSSNNNSTYKATIPNFKINIDGSNIDNRAEEYSLLNFRGVTYFPLTWKFAVDTFDWNYDFNDETGLNISTKQLSPIQVDLDILDGSDISIIGKSIYYVKNSNGINGIYKFMDQQDKLIFELPSKISLYASFLKHGSESCFSYYTGGAVMGSYHYYKINEDDSVTEIISGKNHPLEYKDGLIILDSFMPVYSENLLYKNGEEIIELGNKSSLYGWIVKDDGSYIFDKKMQIIDDWLYIKASNVMDMSYLNQLFRINLIDYTEEKVNSMNSLSFKIEGQQIYLHGYDDHLLYKQSINDNEINTVSDMAVESYDVLNSNVYFIQEKTNELYRCDEYNNANLVLPGFKASNIVVEDNYIVATSSLDKNYGMIILNEKGNIIFKTSQLIRRTSIDNNVLVYVTTDNEVYILELVNNI